MRATAWAALLLVGCWGADKPLESPPEGGAGPETAAAPAPLAFEQVTSGLVAPVALTGDLEGRLFIADEPGVVYEVNGALRIPVLDLRGPGVRLLGVAAPDRQAGGRWVFVRYVRGDRERVSAFRVDGGEVREDVLVEARVGDLADPVGLDPVDGVLRASGLQGGAPPAAPSQAAPRLEGLDVVGGHWYAGLAAPGLTGRYVFATADALFTAERGQGNGERWRIRRLEEAPGGTVRALERDGVGELYVLVGGPGEGTGRVLRLVSSPGGALAGSASRGRPSG